jgi:hypothetical protein
MRPPTAPPYAQPRRCTTWQSPDRRGLPHNAALAAPLFIMIVIIHFDIDMWVSH